LKVTIDWLKQYIDFSQSTAELAHELTMLGLEVDSIHDIAYQFDGVVVGEIVELNNHQEKSNLNICKVDIGKEILTLVCGAPNVRKGLRVPVAKVGANFPGGMTVKAATIHGYHSPGMICSEAELGISHQSDIIMELNNEAQIGDDLKSILGRGEVVLEIDLTPNRPDCLGVIGVAREIGALNNTKLKKPVINITTSLAKKIFDIIQVQIDNPESCPRYTASYIEDVKIGPSPRWLIQKLEAVGIRTINNVVDVTNFVMMETGQPLHAFDYDLLEDQKIIVRHAKKGEKFTTLDEKEHILTDTMLLICDGKKPVALAGVMGGLNSEISNDTTNVLLESAYFDPSNTRKTAKMLGISTDSSQRFERGADPEGTIYALNRATQLIQEVAGGKIAKGIIDNYPKPIGKREVKLRVNRVNQLLGTSIKAKEIVDILQRLEFKTEILEDFIHVIVPSFRVDIEREADLIEEVARVYGFDNIEGTNHSTVPYIDVKTDLEKFTNKLTNILVGMGYNEVLTSSLVNKEWAEKFTDFPTIKLRNPISEDLATMRPSLIPGLLHVVKWNKNRTLNNQLLFEIGNVFHWIDNTQQNHHEKQKIALIRTGEINSNNWLEKPRLSTFYDLKGDIFTLLGRLNVKIEVAELSEKYLDHRALKLLLNNTDIGYIGALSLEIQKILDIDDEIFIAELDFEVLYKNFQQAKKFQQIPKFPAIKRDLSILVEQHIPVKQVEEIIWQFGGEHLNSVNLFDFYRGKQIAQHQKSLAFTLSFHSLERTLTEEEIDAKVELIVKNLRSKINSELRS